jgi:hypothetical protein
VIGACKRAWRCHYAALALSWTVSHDTKSQEDRREQRGDWSGPQGQRDPTFTVCNGDGRRLRCRSRSATAAAFTAARFPLSPPRSSELPVLRVSFCSHMSAREQTAARSRQGMPGRGGDGQRAPEDPWWVFSECSNSFSFVRYDFLNNLANQGKRGPYKLLV